MRKSHYRKQFAWIFCVAVRVLNSYEELRNDGSGLPDLQDGARPFGTTLLFLSRYRLAVVRKKCHR